MQEGENGETNTERHLLKRRKELGGDDYDSDARLADLQDARLQYRIRVDDGRQVLTRRGYTDDRRHDASPEEIKALVTQLNKPPATKKQTTYSTNEMNEILKNGRKIPNNLKQKFLHVLNALAERAFGPGKVHYKWAKKQDRFEDGRLVKGGVSEAKEYDWTNVMLVNTTPWDDTDKIDNRRFDTAEYKVVSGEDMEKLLGLLNAASQEALARSEKSASSRKKGKKTYGYDFDAGVFTLDGSPMGDDDLKDMLNHVNGTVKGEYNKEYWRHFKISMKGSKVGDVANFSLPPVVTCAENVPCATTGCYAVKAYGVYPGTRAAQDINYHLLKSGKFDQFVEELTKAISKKFKKNIGALKEGEKIGYFRFHVSGDAFSAPYFRAMCKVAENCKDVGFWTYTKQYAVLEECKGSIPPNMSVVVSCWGEFRPKNVKRKKGSEETFADLEDEFPLAYLDDGTENTHKYIDEESEPFKCPCTDYSDMEVHCDKCLKCYQATGKRVNIKFMKH